MNEILKNVITSIGMTPYYVSRGINNGECVIFNYTSNPSFYADNTIKGTNYNILLNVRVKQNIERTNKNIINAMNSIGINGGTIQATQLESTSDGTGVQYYNTAITFNTFIKNN